MVLCYSLQISTSAQLVLITATQQELHVLTLKGRLPALVMQVIKAMVERVQVLYVGLKSKLVENIAPMGDFMCLCGGFNIETEIVLQHGTDENVFLY